MKTNVAIVIPNYNGKERLAHCIDKVLAQTIEAEIIVVENASTDGSYEFLQTVYPMVEVVRNKKNLGFSGGVNAGIRRAKELGMKYVALLNNDALPESDWLEQLLRILKKDEGLASVASKMLSADKKTIDSTADGYSIWGLTYARQRDEPAESAKNTSDFVFGASAGAALYRLEALDQVGNFDEDFFAYYEDTDLNFRLQLAGWKSRYCPDAAVSHMTGSTSSGMKGLTTYQTFSNLPFVFWKNVPLRLMPSVLPRFAFAYSAIYVNSILQGRGWPATKGLLRSLTFLPKKLSQRHKIQKSRKASLEYIDSILVHDLPPNATSLRKLRSFFAGTK